MLFRNRDKSKSAGDDSAASRRKKFLSYFRAVYSQSRRIRDIVCKAVDVYRKLSSKLKFEKLHIAASQERRALKETEEHKKYLIKKSRCNEMSYECKKK